MNEQDRRLAVQNALVYSKIARFEFPNDWPDAITSLLDAVRNGQDDQRSYAALLVLLQVTKELSTGRLLSTRRNLQTITPEMLHVIGQRYVTYVDQWRHVCNILGMGISCALNELFTKPIVAIQYGPI